MPYWHNGSKNVFFSATRSMVLRRPFIFLEFSNALHAVDGVRHNLYFFPPLFLKCELVVHAKKIEIRFC